MSNLTEKQKIKQVIKDYKNRYPAARRNKKDKNLVGEILEKLTREALTYIGLKPYAYAQGEGDRGIDVKLVYDCFKSPLAFAIECMNGRFDYTDEYIRNLKNRLEEARIDDHHPIIICVDKKINFQRFKGNVGSIGEFIELGKQFHPNTTTYADYLDLKKQLENTINKVAWRERPQEMAEGKQKMQEDQELEEEKEALEAIDEEKLKIMENVETERDRQD